MTQEAMTTAGPEPARPVSDLEHRFNYHAPDDGKRLRHEAVRSACLELAVTIDVECPDGREKSTAIAKVEEAMYWANAAIARER